MNAQYGSMDLNDDMDGPLRFNFDPGSLLPAFAIPSNQPNVSGGSPKLNRRPAGLQILSPRARAANASKVSLQPQLPSQNNAKDKGKGRVRPADIIELSDSDEEVEIVTFPTINSIQGPSQRVPSAGLTNTNKPPPPASSDAFTTLPAPIQEETIPRNIPLADRAAVEERADAGPREDAVVAETSNSNPLDRLIASVLEIIPDVDPGHVMALFTSNNPGGDAERASQLLEPILHSLFENGNYPKRQVETKRKRQEEGDVPTAGPSQHKKKKIETMVKMNVATIDRPPIASMDYYELSMVRQTYATRDVSYLPLVLAWGELPLCPDPLLEDDAYSTQEPLRASICTPYEPSKHQLDSRGFSEKNTDTPTDQWTHDRECGI
jgi:hypothetical protein